MKGRVRIKIINCDGQCKHDYVLENRIQDVVRDALAAKVRNNTPFPSSYVPNFLGVTSNLLETVTPRIQARFVQSNGGMYFFTIAQFTEGDDNNFVHSVSLLNSDLWPIASADGSSIQGVQFSPSDQLEVAYMIDLSLSERSTAFSRSYFQDISKVMVGVRNIIDYEADNSQFLVPNLAELETEFGGQLGSKSFSPKGTGSFIGTSEGDLEWQWSSGVTPYYVNWFSSELGGGTKNIGVTTLDQELRDSYPLGSNIETRFSMELRS